MNVFVDKGRFLSVPCDQQERIVFDRKECKYHLLRESAARLWEQIEAGGTFELDLLSPTEGKDDPVGLLREAGLLELVEKVEAGPPAPQISRRTWMGRTGKLAAATAVLPLVASLMTPRIALGGGQHRGSSTTQDVGGGPSADIYKPGDDSTSSNYDSTTQDSTHDSTHDYTPYQTYGSWNEERWSRWKEWLARFWWN